MASGSLNNDSRDVVTLLGGPCGGQRFKADGPTIEPLWVDFSNPATPTLRQVRYERIEGTDQAVYAGVIGGSADLCA